MNAEHKDHDLFAYFEKQIQEEGLAELKALKDKVESDILEKKQDIERALVSKYALKLELSKAELYHQYEQKSRDYETKKRQEYGLKRQEFMQSLFSRVESKIHQFYQTTSYEKLLNESFKSLKSVHSSFEGTINYRHDDKILLSLVKKQYPHLICIEDVHLQFGGFYFQFEGAKSRYDFTLDNRWSVAKDRFYEQGVVE